MVTARWLISLKFLYVSSAMIGSILLGWGHGWSVTQDQDKIEQVKVKRVKRPKFTEKDTKGIFFGDVFADAIQGERPDPMANPLPGDPTKNGSAIVRTEGDDGGFAWSNFISGDVLETEIKRLQQRLMRQVTSPGKFKTGYPEARQSYEELSMLFGIIVEHDEDVRWKRVANLAQPTYAAAAKKSRRGDKDAYNYALARRDDLAELVRGGNMSSTEKEVTEVVWGDAIGRSPLMVRLQNSVDSVKPMLSSKEEFAANKEEILHEANLLAAMSEVLGKESMDDAEEEDYVDYAKSMSAGARLMMSSLVADNYDAVSEGFNQVNQACSNCHDEWR